MKADKRYFAPQNENEEEIFNVEDLIFDVQIALQAAMRQRGVTQKELAESLSLSPARVSQFFSEDGGNLTLATVARIAHALKLRPGFGLQEEGTNPPSCEGAWETFRYSKPSVVWKDTSANKNVVPIEIAA